MKLNRDRIVAEAIAILREEGLDAVSLRRVAARLDARAPSLARHVGDKQMLLALMSRQLFREALDAVPPGADWRQWLMEFGRALWRKQRDTRDIAKLIAYAPPHEEADGQTIAMLDTALRSVGLPIERGMMMQSAVQALVTGWTGFVTGTKGPRIEALIPVETAVEASLAAMVNGFAGEEKLFSQSDFKAGGNAC
ncbi:MAG: hypothetical protein B7Z20_03185 [Sphingobium sp. 32-64-5]|nr:MAG: hypothetical protein B7Z20_03185 [Sphingobium sp. 32-64-5]